MNLIINFETSRTLVESKKHILAILIFINPTKLYFPRNIAFLLKNNQNFQAYPWCVREDSKTILVTHPKILDRNPFFSFF